MSVSDINGRIAEIQSRISQLAPPPAAPAPKASFSDVLGSVSNSRPAATPMTGNDVVADASKYLGVPYQWGGTDPSTGLDCSGLVQRAYADLGVQLPRVAADQAKMGTPVDGLANAQPGDLVAFGEPVDHIGIYAGDGKMVVAPHTGDVVKVQDIAPRTPTAIRRIVGTDAAAGPGASSYASQFAAAGSKYGVDPKLLSAIAKAESGYNPSAVSGAGAEGLMQIMPSTAAGLGVDPMNPTQAIDGAARIMAGNLQKFGSLDQAVAAYNAGGGAVARYGGVPPYSETQNYVRRVLANYQGAATS